MQWCLYVSVSFTLPKWSINLGYSSTHVNKVSDIYVSPRCKNAAEAEDLYYRLLRPLSNSPAAINPLAKACAILPAPMKPIVILSSVFAIIISW